MSHVLITGGTGFIGRNLTRSLIEAGHQVRLLVRPSQSSPKLDTGVPIDVVVTSLNDRRGLRAAMVGIDTVYHLAGAEWKGAYESLLEIDILGTQRIANVAAEVGIDRFLYVSHLGADRASAYPVMKAKAIAEEHIRRSGVNYTIFRSAVVFGPQDGFTSGLGLILKTIPYIFLMPGDGRVLLQPIWLEDLVACLTWVIDDPETNNQLFEVGGAEYLTISQIVQTVGDALNLRPAILNLGAPYLRGLTILLESVFPGSPISVYWLDYLAANRTCALDTLPRYFHIMPSRFSTSRLSYLAQMNWRKEFFRVLFARRLKRRKQSRI